MSAYGYTQTPIMLAGVGSGLPVRWTYSHYGNFLNVYGITNGISLTFNLKSAEDVDTKLKTLYRYRDLGMCHTYDVDELEERLRTLCDFVVGGNEEQTLSAISELDESVKRKKGEKYTDADGKIHTAKGSRKTPVSDIQREHLDEIRPLAHSDSANAKRRATIQKKRDRKVLGI